MTGPTVLVAGLYREENQFTRTLRKHYDCNVVWTDLDSKSFPTNVDLAILVTSHINRQKMHNIKEVFRNLEKPIFTANHGFSEIKVQFENYLYERGKSERDAYTVKKPTHSLRKPFNPAIDLTSLQKAQEIAEPIKKDDAVIDHVTTVLANEFIAAHTRDTKEVEEMPKKKQPRLSHPTEVLQKIYRIVWDCKIADMDAADTVAMLESEGFKRASGKPYDTRDIHGFRWAIGKNPSMLGETPVKETVPDPQLTLQTTPAPAPTDPMALIGRVVGSHSLGSELKLQLIAKIQAGKLASLNVAEKEVTSDINGKPEIVFHIFNLEDGADAGRSIYLSQEQASVISSNMAALSQFAQTGKLG